MQNEVNLLETTLRDGSYAIDFQFVPEDTAFLVGALDAAGIRYIEMGHGNGFRFESWGTYPIRAAAAEEAHLEAARSVVTRAALGVILVGGPKNSPLSDLDILAKHKLDFVRLAMLPDSVSQPEYLNYINRAKELGFTVSVNLVQTYDHNLADVGRTCAEIARRGADWIYVVDSAGGMHPAEIREYVKIGVDSGMRVGLHAHNNSGIAVANCLAAIEAGATLVDGTLQGLGRTTGNPPTEQLVLALQKQGFEQALDRDIIFHLGDVMRPLLEGKGDDPSDFIFGWERLPWPSIPWLWKIALERKLSPRAFLSAVSHEAKTRNFRGRATFPQEIVDAAAARTPEAREPKVPAQVVKVLGSAMRSTEYSLEAMCRRLRSDCSKYKKASVLHVVASEKLFPFSVPLYWETAEHVGFTVPRARVTDWSVLPQDQHPDYLVCDPTAQSVAQGYRGTTVPMAEHAVFGDSVWALISSLSRSETSGPAVGLWKADALLTEMATKLRLEGAQVKDGADNARFVITARLGEELLASLSRGTALVVLETPSATQQELIERAKQLDCKIFRLHPGIAVSARLAAFINTRHHLWDKGGRTPLVSPFVIPTGNEVVVNDRQLPRQMLESSVGDTEKTAEAVALAYCQSLLSGYGHL